jgi:uncharacterized protein YyaL (SSP411 family)
VPRVRRRPQRRARLPGRRGRPARGLPGPAPGGGRCALLGDGATALGLADQLATRFYDENEGDFFLTPVDGQKLVHRPRSDHDGATPHSAGLAALGLHRVATLSGREDLRAIVDRVLDSHAYLLDRAPEAFHTLARVALAAERGLSVAVVLGDANDEATRALADRARRVLLPEDAVLVVAPGGPAPDGVDPDWLAGRELRDGRATAYVCRGVTCSLPATTPDELAAASAVGARSEA